MLLGGPALRSALGGPWGLAGIVGLQLGLLAVFLVQPEAAVALVFGVISAAVVVRRPLWGVGLLIAARLFTTGALVFFRVGRFGVGPYELALVLCLGALVLRAALTGARPDLGFPWRNPALALLGWMVVSLGWSVDRSDGLGVLLPLGMAGLNTLVILTFVRGWSDFVFAIRAWLGACVAVGLATLAGNALGLQVGVSFEIAAAGGRETGLGQQPNWFAMGLMFIVPTAAAMVLLERRWYRALGVAAAAFFVVVTMLSSGSRGGAYASLIGVGLIALGQVRVRRALVGLGLVGLLGLGLAWALDLGNLNRALYRISQGVQSQFSYRPWNWEACVRMFLDSEGLGIGVGGYQALLPEYNFFLSRTLYDYPHGIFWQVLAHLGVVGLVLLGWLVWAIVALARDTVRRARGTEAELFAWAMPAAMLGYAAWSFVEFQLEDKPFWEFLALYTALNLALRRAEQGGERPPPWSLGAG